PLPLMMVCRHQGRAGPLRRSCMTSNPLIVAYAVGIDLKPRTIPASLPLTAWVLGTDIHQEFELGCANLQDAKLWGAKLQGADLTDVNLQGADLISANLRGANLESFYSGEPIYNDGTIFPNNYGADQAGFVHDLDRKSTRLNSSHVSISYAV